MVKEGTQLQIEDAPSRKKFIIDTDAGADDAVAILYTLGAEKLKDNVRTIGITCAYGNTEVDNVVVNVLKTLKTVDRLDVSLKMLGLSGATIYNGISFRYRSTRVAITPF